MTRQYSFIRAQVPEDLIRTPCAGCRLDGLTYPVTPRGNLLAKVVLAGEAPGKIEEMENCTFIGPAGQKLQEYFSLAGLDLDTMFLLPNVVQCRPTAAPGSGKENDTPDDALVSACSNNFKALVEYTPRSLIVAVGKTAACRLLKKPPKRISDITGKFLPPDSHIFDMDADFYAMWHPSFILRDQAQAPAWRLQIAKLRDTMISRCLI